MTSPESRGGRRASLTITTLNPSTDGCGAGERSVDLAKPPARHLPLSRGFVAGPPDLGWLSEAQPKRIPTSLRG